MFARTLLALVALAWSATFVGRSVAQAPDLFPEANSPLVVPGAEPKRTSPFLEEAETLSPPKGSMAVSNAGALNNLFSNQWVQTNGTGALKGTVVTPSGEDTLSVSGSRVILSQRGRLVASTISNSDGEFYIGNVAPGFYSIVAEADNSFAAFGLAVLGSDSGAHLPSSLELRVIRPKGESIKRIFGVDLSPMMVSGTISGAFRDPLAAKRVYAKSHRILSSEDGKITGRLSKMGMESDLVDMSQMKAMILKDGNEIGRTDVARDGAFTFNNIAPGCYGLVAAGNQGVAAVAFCVIKPDSVASKRSRDGKFFVATAVGSLQDSASPSLNVMLADGADVMAVQNAPGEEIVEEEIVEGAPFALAPMGGQAGAGQVIGGGGGGIVPG